MSLFKFIKKNISQQTIDKYEMLRDPVTFSQQKTIHSSWVSARNGMSVVNTNSDLRSASVTGVL